MAMAHAPVRGLAAAFATLAAGPALARSSASDPVFRFIPPGDRLTLVSVYTDAMPAMQLIYTALLLAVAAAVVVWVVQLARLSRQKTAGAARAIAYLSGQAAAAPMFGLFGMIFALVVICIGITNKRPGPTLLALAPGLAEALLALCLGVLAAVIAIVAQRHLSARLRAVSRA